MNYWEELLYFFSFTDASISKVLIGTVLLGLSAGIVGSLVVLSKKTLIVDAISHSMLPGICIGFLLSGVKNPLYLLLGGMSTAVISVMLISAIKKRSKIKMDGAIAIALSFLFSLGVITLNLVQNSGNPNQSGLSDFLFGKAASMLWDDLIYFGILSVISFIAIPLFMRQFKITLFDPIFAESIGIKRLWIQTLISFLTIITAAAGVQTVGIILMSAMIIAPAASSLFWTQNFGKSIAISGIIGIACAVIGVYISYLAPQMPTGPWVVICLATVAFISVLFSPKGLLIKQLQQYNNQTRIGQENLLKKIYKLQEKSSNHSVELSSFNSSNAKQFMRSLQRKHLLLKLGTQLTLTEKGMVEAERIIRIHRLWELYLQKYMDLPSNMVHDSAESIEHIITPELERSLEQLMGKPTLDPHHQKIPYQK